MVGSRTRVTIAVEAQIGPASRIIGPEALARLSGWFRSAIKAPDMKPKLAQQGLFPVGTCGAEFGTYLRRQGEEYSRIIREANITVK